MAVSFIGVMNEIVIIRDTCVVRSSLVLYVLNLHTNILILNCSLTSWNILFKCLLYHKYIIITELFLLFVICTVCELEPRYPEMYWHCLWPKQYGCCILDVDVLIFPDMCYLNTYCYSTDRVSAMGFNATFNNISATTWGSVLILEETWVSGENQWPATSH
jgi:hypothetical protein